ncbi:sigma-54 dependent transcriptional regulator [Pseudoduganella umbonata]|uniref:DNA-binding NtrC family response regulator n=1 Tax=Pseudoduganella umbonata TaxID=864828 RepID=A0A4P8HMA6_9BURK|nr:sigma-54 dependent transcriptional regulator [Pseudoduganella umbonata]MBB3219374.1 DNA-binding NtrC family response regulator [Pseudoduganella umbonata]QCP09468.1 sigma-54-dependent Fis family transcriptional regulator [Pseudoduganella umbonata]
MLLRQLLCIPPPDANTTAVLATAATGFTIRPAHDPAAAHMLLRAHPVPVGLVVLDGAADTGALDRLLREHSRTRWIALCAAAALGDAACRKLVADHCLDFHTMPVDAVRLRQTLGHAYGMAGLDPPPGEVPHAAELHASRLTGSSEPISRLRRQLHKVAAADAPVLIWGESGTGKELAARAVHEGSARAAGPFVPINCGAIPASLVQSELFGHERGAFSGAGRARAGLIESAAGGSVFLDEIGDLPLDMQVNLLRFLQEKTIYRLGGTRPLPVDVRVIAASHVRLDDAVARGTFREDLYYRLNVLTLEMPPLRERREDVPALAETFFRDHARERSAHVRGFSRGAMEAMHAHHWPGNVRELHNRVRRAAVMAEGRLIMPHDLGLDGALVPALALHGARVQAERRAIEAGLGAGKSITHVARELGVSRMTVYRLMAKHSIVPPARKREA